MERTDTSLLYDSNNGLLLHYIIGMKCKRLTTCMHEHSPQLMHSRAHPRLNCLITLLSLTCVKSLSCYHTTHGLFVHQPLNHLSPCLNTHTDPLLVAIHLHFGELATVYVRLLDIPRQPTCMKLGSY